MSLACSCVRLDIYLLLSEEEEEATRLWGQGLGRTGTKFGFVVLWAGGALAEICDLPSLGEEPSPASEWSQDSATGGYNITTNTTVTTGNQHTLEDVNEVVHKEIKSFQLCKSWFAGIGSNVIKHKIQVIIKSKNLHIFVWQMVTSTFIASINIFSCNCCSFSSSNF